MIRKKPSSTSTARRAGRHPPSPLYPVKDDWSVGTASTASTASSSVASSRNASSFAAIGTGPSKGGGGDGSSRRVGRECLSPPKRLGMTFNDYYVIKQKIDSGSFSTVYEAVHRFNGTRYAVKVIDRRRLTRQSDDAVFREAKILQRLHKAKEDLGIIRLVDFFIEPKRFYLVMDYMAGGCVFDRVLDKQCYSEGDARKFAANLLEALSYMHSLNIVHRDLKPQNLLLGSHGDDTDVRIADFGFATAIRPKVDEKGVPDRKVLNQKCGTPSYVAPEVLSGKPYDGATADMWSVGVIMYFVIGGYPPFVDYESKTGLFTQIMKGDYDFHETDWKGVSREAKDFISGLLTVDPDARITAAEALCHPWIRGRPNKVVRPERAVVVQEHGHKQVLQTGPKHERTNRVKGAGRKVLGAFNCAAKPTNNKNEASASPTVRLYEETSPNGRTNARVLSPSRRQTNSPRNRAATQ